MPQHGALQQNEMKRGKLIDTYVYDKPKNSATFHQCGTSPFVHLLTVEKKTAGPDQKVALCPTRVKIITYCKIGYSDSLPVLRHQCGPQFKAITTVDHDDSIGKHYYQVKLGATV